MFKFTDRQRAYHQQVLKEVHGMLTSPKASVKPFTASDHDWASKKLTALLANCKG